MIKVVGISMAREHDKRYKKLLTRKKNMMDFLTHFTEFKELIKDASEDDFQLIDKEFITKDYREKEADVIYRVRLGEREVIFYLLLELQSYVDFAMPIRLLTYMTEILQREFLNADPKRREQKAYRLPAVLPIVLYNGAGKWTAATKFREYQQGHDSFSDKLLSFEYLLLDVNRMNVEDLLAVGSLMAVIFAVDSSRNVARLTETVTKALKAVRAFRPDEQNEFKTWLANLVANNTQKERIAQIIEENIAKGDEVEMASPLELLAAELKEEGKKEGKMETKVETAKNALEAGVSVEMVCRITGLDEKTVKKLLPATV
jgi:predicted transposase/invertase (TIGR01784 family)